MVDRTPTPSEHRIRSYVRRAGRMTRAQRRARKDLWPRYGVEIGGDRLDVTALFDGAGPVVLDIGFGDGEALVELAKRFPSINYLGVEVYEPGIGHLLLRLQTEGLINVRVVNADVVDVLSRYLSQDCLAAVNLFFPDPWPKKRHFKRRLVQEPFMQSLRRALRRQGLFHVATDWAPYVEHVRSVLEGCGDFREIAPPAVAEDPLAARPATKFERRGLALGHAVTDLFYRRI